MRNWQSFLPIFTPTAFYPKIKKLPSLGTEALSSRGTTLLGHIVCPSCQRVRTFKVFHPNTLTTE